LRPGFSFETEQCQRDRNSKPSRGHLKPPVTRTPS